MTDLRAVISFDNVSKIYGAERALDGVTLDVQEREFLAVVGPSGSGKSTLLRLVNRLMDASEGTSASRARTCTLDPVALRRRIGYVFQGVGLFPHMTVAENIGVAPRLLGWDRARDRGSASTNPARTGPARSAHLSRPLSARALRRRGQRVGVARALAASRSRADGRAVRRARSAHARRARPRLPQLHEELGLTTVMITHDTLEAVLLADRIAVIRRAASWPRAAARADGR
jgi:osmoprotectant transport system ATP-binding protein